jgi:hypothetical protein
VKQTSPRRQPRALRWTLPTLLATVVPVRADLTQDYVSWALQGDLLRARIRFEATPDSALAPAERELVQRFRERFVLRTEEPPLPDDPFARDVVRAYQDYWTRSLLRELAADEGEAFLRAALERGLARHRVAARDSADAFDRMGVELARRGFHHLGGVTLPYFELMLWSGQDTTRYDVELGDTVQPVDVVFLSDFAVRGWAHFATFGRASTGGWATENALFCLREDYDLDSEKFLVSYLQHEARHFADYARFPELEQIDLEYRGKLTELVFARDSQRSLLEHFESAGAPNEAAPHSYANWAVTKDVGRALGGVAWRDADAETIRRIARELLEANTAELVAAGADTVRRVVRR